MNIFGQPPPLHIKRCKPCNGRECSAEVRGDVCSRCQTIRLAINSKLVLLMVFFIDVSIFSMLTPPLFYCTSTLVSTKNGLLPKKPSDILDAASRKNLAAPPSPETVAARHVHTIKPLRESHIRAFFGAATGEGAKQRSGETFSWATDRKHHTSFLPPFTPLLLIHQCICLSHKLIKGRRIFGVIVRYADA